MNCPICEGVSLVMSERSGIEIDYCPKCRGVWLDRGELDKIIERAASPAPPPVAVHGAPGAGARAYSQAPQHAPSHSSSHHEGGYYKKKKREGFLGELFDF
jgi:Zn-finger nucleic acid-binding protein